MLAGRVHSLPAMTIRLEQYPVCGDALLEEGVEHRVKDPLPPSNERQRDAL